MGSRWLALVRQWVVIACALAMPRIASATTIHGLVYDDQNDDGQPSAGEPGVAGVIVAVGVHGFVETDASGQFDIELPNWLRSGIAWARVPDGFSPGPVWAVWNGTDDVDLALHRLAEPIRGPVTFVVASDTHIGIDPSDESIEQLARAARAATALEPAPAFFTILGDVTQGNQDVEFEAVRKALANLGVPWIPVPGNHDWYDRGAAWFRNFGPDNYSFDIGGVHFLVWNMALPPDELRGYLAAELSHVPASMTVVALTHDPPRGGVIDVLREVGIDYVLTGHAHSNRVVDHDGIIELNTEPFLMGGIDFTPAGYRVVTISASGLSSYHRTVVDEPVLTVVAPTRDGCVPASGGELLVAAELDGGDAVVSARVDSATPFELQRAGGWVWRGSLGSLSQEEHLLEIEAVSAGGARATTSKALRVCGSPRPAVPEGAPWAQTGGSGGHTGSTPDELAPPLETRWVAALGNHVLTSAPIIADGTVYVATTDLANGDGGGVVAVDLVSGSIRWRHPTARPIRGGLAFNEDTVVTAQIDGTVEALDAASGAVRWQRAMSMGLPPQASAIFAPPTVDGDKVFVGHQRAAGMLSLTDGTSRWMAVPVPDGIASQTAAAIAVGSGLAVGTFDRELGGVIAWDAGTGALRWRYSGPDVVAVNATPLITGDSVFLVNAATEVVALDLQGRRRWITKLDGEGFDWGYGAVGTPALSNGLLIVPTLYGSLVALDAQTGKERWRYRARTGPLHGTHYRGKANPAFAASPIVTGDIVWVVDTAGVLSALDVQTGLVRWYTELETPVMAGLAASGDWLVTASYDGTLRALTPASCTPAVCRALRPDGCSTGGGSEVGAGMLIVLAYVLRRFRR